MFSARLWVRVGEVEVLALVKASGAVARALTGSGGMSVAGDPGEASPVGRGESDMDTGLSARWLRASPLGRTRPKPG